MPFKVSCQDNGAGVLYVSTGLFTGKEFLETKENLLQSKQQLKKVRYLIYDLIQMDSLDFPFDDFKKLEDADCLVAEVNPSLK